MGEGGQLFISSWNSKMLFLLFCFCLGSFCEKVENLSV